MKHNHSGRGNEIAELARLLPVPEERDLPAGREQPLKEQLLNEFRLASHGSQAAGRAGRASRAGRAPWRSWPPKRPAFAAAVVSGVLATAVAGVAIALSIAAQPTAGPGTEGQAQQAATVRLLAKIAVAASRQPALAVRGHQWEYIKIVEKEPFTGPAELTPQGTKPPRKEKLKTPPRGRFTTYHTQLWRPVSDICLGFVVRTTPSRGASSPPSAPTYGGPGEKCPSTGDLNRSTYRLLQSLPTGPHRLLNLIYAKEKGHGPGPAQEAFTTIGDLLRESIVPPRTSAALYRAAALIPGVTVVPDAVNAIGRHGVAVALTTGGVHGAPDVREQWIFDKTTLRLIGESTVANGSVTYVSAVIDRAFVDHPGQTRPTGG